MHVKIVDNSIHTYPYNTVQLRKDNLDTSFPSRISDEILSSYGVFPVTFADMPSINIRTQMAEQKNTPSLVESTWTVGWTIISKTANEISEYDSGVALFNRNNRDGLLSNSDWTQVADAPVSAAAWATYRQALRDLPSHSNWPNLESGNWPTKP